MSFTVDDALEQKIVSLFPLATRPGKSRAQAALELLVETERYKRGERDATGAYHPFALLHGPLVKDEYDLSTHGHLAAWSVGIVTADLRGTIHYNQRYGFEVGDRALAAVVDSLEATFPKAKVVRIHADAFAALLLPSSELQLDPAVKPRLHETIAERVTSVLPEDGARKPDVEATIGMLQLEIVKPSHWQVLGPILWAEAERAHVVERSGKAAEIQRRRVVLDAAV